MPYEAWLSSDFYILLIKSEKMRYLWKGIAYLHKIWRRDTMSVKNFNF